MAYKLTTDKSWAANEAAIREQLHRWGAATYSLDRPNSTKKTALSWTETPEEALVVLKAAWKSGRELNLSYNKQARAVDNARVLFLVVESMRLNEVRGIDDVMREAYLQLPAPKQAVRERDPYEVLGIRPDAPKEVAEAAYRELAKSAHPDGGGRNETMVELNKAIEAVRKG